MMFRFFIILAMCIFFIPNVKAQRVLPNFSVEDLGKNRTRISWVNGFNEACIQLNVQRSYDSIKNFTTVFSALSPELPQNGFVDDAPYNGRIYYRIFYVLDGGAYYFTKSKLAATGFSNEAIIPTDDSTNLITIFFRNTVLKQVYYSGYLKFRDSIIHYTRDSLFTINQQEVLLKPFDPGSSWVPSIHVFTNRDGFVDIMLFDAKQKNYKLIFYTSNGKKIFTINHVSETELTLDKTNFVRAGWYNFDLYENDNLIETNKVLLQQDF